MIGKPTVTSNFATAVNVATVDYDVGRVQPASGGTVAGGTLAYDAGTDSFTLTAGPDQMIFGPGDVTIDTGNFLRYEKAKGNSLTQFDLDWGQRSDWTSTPDYVALGSLFSRQRVVATGIDSYRAIDFAFGLLSEASAIPRTGKAAYDLRFSGTRTAAAIDRLLGLLGEGVALVDFGTGQLEISGTTVSSSLLGGGISDTETEGDVRASGALVSGENKFTGTFSATSGGATYTGDLAGSFYGPAADDIGGTLYGTSGPLYYSLAFEGYGLPETGPDDTLTNLAGTTRLGTAQSFIDLPAGEYASPREGIIHEGIVYNADTQTYSVFNFGRYTYGLSFGPDNRTADKDSGDLRAYGAADPTADGKVQYSIGLFDGETDGIQLTYTSFMRVFASQTDLDGEKIGESVEYIAFGNSTSPNQLPRTGTATYAGRLFGDAYDGTKLLGSLTGRSDLTANFGTGALTAALSPVRNNADGSSTALGRYDFTGAIDRFKSAFGGRWNLGAGTINGRFYGDSAQEFGAVFNIDDPVAGKMTGVTVGRRQ